MRRILSLGFVLFLISESICSAVTIPPGFKFQQVAANLTNPTAMEVAPDGRVFICEQGGTVRIVKSGALLAQPFVTISVNSTSENGLIGIAFDPSFSTNRYVYLYYTTNAPVIHNRISRFTANGDVAVPGSEVVLFDISNNVTNIHNSGSIHFGADKKLYIVVGDNYDSSNAQTLNNHWGKILRINKDGSIPTDNPFYNLTTGTNRAIWALGLRNPFTFAVQKGTGRIFINDVGDLTWEEINEGVKGANYGWPNVEGDGDCNTYSCPVFAYGHGVGDTVGCAITGGTFYNPSTQQFPADYQGDYFFADYCEGWIRRYDPASDTADGFALSVATSIVDLKVSSGGSLYVLARGATSIEGGLFRIFYTATQTPSIAKQPSSQIISVGEDVTFSVEALGAIPLNYQWQRDRVNIAGANSSSYTLSGGQLSDDGALFRCIVTNSHGTTTSQEALLTVTSNTAPFGVIQTPTPGTTYAAGNTINYTGDASDAEDGSLPDSAFTWQVDFHHDDHHHPFIPSTSGSKSGSFTIPTTGETSPNVWYRILLKVVDSGGRTHTSQVDVLPRKCYVTIKTNNVPLQLRLDGRPVIAPFSFIAVAGMNRTIEAVSPQVLDTTTWTWVKWSNGGAQLQTVTIPDQNNIGWTATYISGTATGTGLSATYYNNPDFTGTSTTRVDPQVNFNWGTGAPAPGINGDTFSVRWTGYVQPRYSQTYTFYTNTDDGARLWINGQVIIDRWMPTPGESSGTIYLIGGQKYSIKMEYYEDTASAKASLLWSSPSQVKAVILKSRLYPQ